MVFYKKFLSYVNPNETVSYDEETIGSSTIVSRDHARIKSILLRRNRRRKNTERNVSWSIDTRSVGERDDDTIAEGSTFEDDRDATFDERDDTFDEREDESVHNSPFGGFGALIGIDNIYDDDTATFYASGSDDGTYVTYDVSPSIDGVESAIEIERKHVDLPGRGHLGVRKVDLSESKEEAGIKNENRNGDKSVTQHVGKYGTSRTGTKVEPQVKNNPQSLENANQVAERNNRQDGGKHGTDGTGTKVEPQVKKIPQSPEVDLNTVGANASTSSFQIDRHADPRHEFNPTITLDSSLAEAPRLSQTVNPDIDYRCLACASTVTDATPYERYGLENASSDEDMQEGNGEPPVEGNGQLTYVAFSTHSSSGLENAQSERVNEEEKEENGRASSVEVDVQVTNNDVNYASRGSEYNTKSSTGCAEFPDEATSIPSDDLLTPGPAAGGNAVELDENSVDDQSLIDRKTLSDDESVKSLTKVDRELFKHAFQEQNKADVSHGHIGLILPLWDRFQCGMANFLSTEEIQNDGVASPEDNNTDEVVSEEELSKEVSSSSATGCSGEIGMKNEVDVTVLPSENQVGLHSKEDRNEQHEENECADNTEETGFESVGTNQEMGVAGENASTENSENRDVADKVAEDKKLKSDESAVVPSTSLNVSSSKYEKEEKCHTIIRDSTSNELKSSGQDKDEKKEISPKEVFDEGESKRAANGGVFKSLMRAMSRKTTTKEAKEPVALEEAGGDVPKMKVRKIEEFDIKVERVETEEGESEKGDGGGEDDVEGEDEGGQDEENQILCEGGHSEDEHSNDKIDIEMEKDMQDEYEGSEDSSGLMHIGQIINIQQPDCDEEICTPKERMNKFKRNGKKKAGRSVSDSISSSDMAVRDSPRVEVEKVENKLQGNRKKPFASFKKKFFRSGASKSFISKSQPTEKQDQNLPSNDYNMDALQRHIYHDTIPSIESCVTTETILNELQIIEDTAKLMYQEKILGQNSNMASNISSIFSPDMDEPISSAKGFGPQSPRGSGFQTKKKSKCASRNG